MNNSIYCCPPPPPPSLPLLPPDILKVIKMDNSTTFQGDNSSIFGTGTYSITLIPESTMIYPINIFGIYIENIILQNTGLYLMNVDLSNLHINAILDVKCIPVISAPNQTYRVINVFHTGNIVSNPNKIQLFIAANPIYADTPTPPYNGPVMLVITSY